MASRPHFSEGDWVFYFNPGHQWHMMMFQIVRIVPMTMQHPGGYDLRYGAQQVFAKVDQILHRRDSQVPGQVLRPNVSGHWLGIASGQDLDKIGQIMGLPRIMDFGGYAETDTHYRARLQDAHSKSLTLRGEGSWPTSVPVTVTIPAENHDGHEVVENWAGGKSFFYCRKCKVEVRK